MGITNLQPKLNFNQLVLLFYIIFHVIKDHRLLIIVPLDYCL